LNDSKLNADGRIKHFLEKRDPSRYGLKDDEEEMYRKHFAAAQRLLPAKEDKKSETDRVAEKS
jgi:hypothetical protein